MKRVSHLNPYRMFRESAGMFNFGRINGYVLLGSFITLLVASTGSCGIFPAEQAPEEEVKEIIIEKPEEANNSVKAVCTESQVNKEKTPTSVITPPQYNGGHEKLIRFIAQSAAEVVDYTIKNGIMGRVVCQFTVNEDGSLSDIEVTRGLDTYLDSVAVKTIKNMPNWIPATENGQPIKIQHTLPIMFRQAPY